MDTVRSRPPFCPPPVRAISIAMHKLRSRYSIRPTERIITLTRGHTPPSRVTAPRAIREVNEALALASKPAQALADNWVIHAQSRLQLADRMHPPPSQLLRVAARADFTPAHDVGVASGIIPARPRRRFSVWHRTAVWVVCERHSISRNGDVHAKDTTPRESVLGARVGGVRAAAAVPHAHAHQ